MTTGKGGQIIICLAGLSSFRFVNDSKLIFRCKSGPTENHHSQMNSVLFKDWFIQVLINLEEPCVIVMNNASYHSGLVDNYPKSNENKINVQK